MHGDAFAPVPTQGEDSEDEGRLASVERTQKMLGGITRREVEKMIKRSELQSIKLGRRRMILLKSIDELIARKLEEEATKRLEVTGSAA